MVIVIIVVVGVVGIRFLVKVDSDESYGELGVEESCDEIIDEVDYVDMIVVFVDVDSSGEY